jgi:uncharacterized protein YbcI
MATISKQTMENPQLQLSEGIARQERGIGRSASESADIPQKESSYKTQGGIEAEVSEVIRRYSIEYFGRGPKEVRSHLLGDLLLIRALGTMTVAEQHLIAKSDENRRLLVKKLRSEMIELARHELEALIRLSTGVDIISMHHDSCAVTGEEIIVFTLAKEPIFRQTRRQLPR